MADQMQNTDLRPVVDRGEVMGAQGSKLSPPSSTPTTINFRQAQVNSRLSFDGQIDVTPHDTQNQGGTTKQLLLSQQMSMQHKGSGPGLEEVEGAQWEKGEMSLGEAAQYLNSSTPALPTCNRNIAQKQCHTKSALRKSESGWQETDKQSSRSQTQTNLSYKDLCLSVKGRIRQVENQLPQFFEESPQEMEERLLAEKERRLELLKTKQSIGLVEEPEELVHGLSDYLKEVGIGTSFLDYEDPQIRQQRPQMWPLLTRALINKYSFESKLLEENLAPVMEKTKEYQEKKQKLEQKLLKKQTKMQKLLTFGDTKSKRGGNVNSSGGGGGKARGSMGELKAGQGYGSTRSKWPSLGPGTGKCNNRQSFFPQVRFHDPNQQPRQQATTRQLRNQDQQQVEELEEMLAADKVPEEMREQVKLKIRQIQRILSLRDAEIACEDWIDGEEMVKAVQWIMGRSDQQYFQKKVLQGTSPVMQMINGHNEKLQLKEFKRNFDYLEQLREKECKSLMLSYRPKKVEVAENKPQSAEKLNENAYKQSWQDALGAQECLSGLKESQGKHHISRTPSAISRWHPTDVQHATKKQHNNTKRSPKLRAQSISVPCSVDSIVENDRDYLSKCFEGTKIFEVDPATTRRRYNNTQAMIVEKKIAGMKKSVGAEPRGKRTSGGGRLTEEVEQGRTPEMENEINYDQQFTRHLDKLKKIRKRRQNVFDRASATTNTHCRDASLNQQNFRIGGSNKLSSSGAGASNSVLGGHSDDQDYVERQQREGEEKSTKFKPGSLFAPKTTHKQPFLQIDLGKRDELEGLILAESQDVGTARETLQGGGRVFERMRTDEGCSTQGRQQLNKETNPWNDTCHLLKRQASPNIPPESFSRSNNSCLESNPTQSKHRAPPHQLKYKAFPCTNEQIESANYIMASPKQMRRGQVSIDLGKQSMRMMPPREDHQGSEQQQAMRAAHLFRSHEELLRWNWRRSFEGSRRRNASVEKQNLEPNSGYTALFGKNKQKSNQFISGYEKMAFSNANNSGVLLGPLELDDCEKNRVSSIPRFNLSQHSVQMDKQQRLLGKSSTIGNVNTTITGTKDGSSQWGWRKFRFFVRKKSSAERDLFENTKILRPSSYQDLLRAIKKEHWQKQIDQSLEYAKAIQKISRTQLKHHRQMAGSPQRGQLFPSIDDKWVMRRQPYAKLCHAE